MFRDSAEVGRALGLLREGLGPFVEREVRRFAAENQVADFIRSRHKLRETRIREWEISVLLNLMQYLWRDVFARTLEPTERGFVNELRGWRNKWAHQETMAPADVDRVLDTAVRLLRAVKAETQAAEIARLWESRKAANAPTKSAVARRSTGGSVPRSSVPTSKPPSRSAWGSQADMIRRYALENYVAPWRESGDETLAIRAGDVEREVGLRQATPNVCSALEGRKFQALANVVLVSREGPRRSTTTTYYYRQS